MHGSSDAAENVFNLTVAAGGFDRTDTVVTAALPPGISPLVRQLELNGAAVSSQLNEDGNLVFVVGKLSRNSSVTYELSSAFELSRPATIQPRPRTIPDRRPLVQLDRAGTKFEFTAMVADSKPRPLMSYQAEPGEFPRADIKPVFKRGGYLHPIMTPSGKLVTDDFPANHIHHHGVWWAWTHTEFDGRQPDFWNMGDGKGLVEFEAVDRVWSGRVHAGIRARHRFVDTTSGTPVTVLNETWQVTAYAAGAASRYWIFDLVSEQQCATGKELKLPTYRYGGVGVRGNWAWNGEGKASFLTSDGETDRDKGNTSRGRWCDMGGEVDGGTVGIAILCHPENFRAPQPMRLHPTEPFFNFAPQQAGDMAIKPGEKFVAKYRFVVHDGPPDQAELDRLCNDYAHPPVVTVSVK